MDASSYLKTEPQKVLANQEQAKKRKYLKPCEERRRNFTPLVFSVDGMRGLETGDQSCLQAAGTPTLGKMGQGLPPNVPICEQPTLDSAGTVDYHAIERPPTPRQSPPKLQLGRGGCLCAPLPTLRQWVAAMMCRCGPRDDLGLSVGPWSRVPVLATPRPVPQPLRRLTESARARLLFVSPFAV